MAVHWEVGKSKGRAVMVRIRVLTLPDTKVYPRPTGLTSRENWRDRYEEEKQMTAAGSPKTGISSRVIHWDIINWRAIEQHVLRLQMRIAKTTRGRRCGKVKCISRDLI
nr:group II intron reverse transcriptase/maturase [Serratia liquefaciens]ULG12936.1 group II intron reverse transcriptase/maturase [Serratia liquefaciens]